MCRTAIERLVYLLRKAEPRINVTSCLTDVYNFHYPKHEIEIDTDFLFRRGGVKLELNAVVDTLTRLGFDVEILDLVSERIKVGVPSFRGTKDVSIKADLVEEVARIYGYDNIIPKTTMGPLQIVKQEKEQTVDYIIKDVLSQKYGLSEVHSYLWYDNKFNQEVSEIIFNNE